MSDDGLYEILYLPQVVEEDIPRLASSIRARVREAIQQKLATDPMRYGKPLRFNMKGYRRLRVGDYRIVYRIEKQTVIIATIDHRKDVYE